MERCGNAMAGNVAARETGLIADSRRAMLLRRQVEPESPILPSPSSRLRRIVAAASCAVLCVALLPGEAAAGERGATDPDVLNTINHMLCRMIESSAHTHGLPVDFLTRLVWQESRFRTGLVSPAGAQGIAQFMPQTAAARGLSDPFAPEAAIGHAASLLADLSRQFGNVGLAAAAYNAGAARVSKWLQGEAALPLETQNYVRLVTGRSAEEWASLKGRGSGSAAETTPITSRSCIVLTADLRRSGSAPLRTWEARLNGSLASAAALISAFERAAAPRPTEKPPLPVAVLPQPTPRSAPDEGPPPPSAAAEELCDSTRALGISCAVYTR